MEDRDLIELILQWKKQYKNIYAVTISEQLFVFRTLTRGEFTDIYDREEWNDQDKEEAFCSVATLYPEGYDFTKCLAGIPVVLTEKILSESLLLDDGKAKLRLSKLRDEMKVYENQIVCTITEAFPTIKLDEIDSWDMHKILYYLSRAEFVLNKLRGLSFVSQEGDVYESIEQYDGQAQYQQQQYQQQQQQRQTAPAKKEEYYVRDDFSRDIDEFDQSKLKELQALQSLAPEIDWLKEDSLLNGTFSFEEESKLTFNAEDAFD